MIPHDAHAKQLLRTFFGEFLELFFPKLARKIRPGSVTLGETSLKRTASPLTPALSPSMGEGEERDTAIAGAFDLVLGGICGYGCKQIWPLIRA